MKPDELPVLLSRGWCFETFPAFDPGLSVVRTWSDRMLADASAWLFIAGDVGRGKTGLSAAVARQFLGTSSRPTALLGRLSPVTEEVAGDTGPLFARWLEVVDLLVLDDLDFGWPTLVPGGTPSAVLADRLRKRLSSGLPTLLTARVPLVLVLERADPAISAVLDRASAMQVSLAGGPSLRTGRTCSRVFDVNRFCRSN